MTRTRRSFTSEDRLSLIQEAEREGFMETCRKHNLWPTLLARWKNRYLEKGAQGLKPAYHRVDPEGTGPSRRERPSQANHCQAGPGAGGEIRAPKKNTYPIVEKIDVIKPRIDKCAVVDLVRWVNLPRSSYYYKPHPGPRGMKPTTHTAHYGLMVPNEEVLISIKDILLSEPYSAYGYDMVTDELRLKGFFINKKKTYRLMDENNLLLGKIIQCKGKRQWVKYRKIQATKPLEYLCLDIKYVWVHGDGRWYYLLSIMDVYSRKILVWLFQKSVRKMDVINLFGWLHQCFNLKGVIIRNDNGSQFIANQVRQFLTHLEAQQEFTHVATRKKTLTSKPFTASWTEN